MYALYYIYIYVMCMCICKHVALSDSRYSALQTHSIFSDTIIPPMRKCMFVNVC